MLFGRVGGRGWISTNTSNVERIEMGGWRVDGSCLKSLGCLQEFLERRSEKQIFLRNG